MFIAISILIIIASLLLTFVVLIQNSKGGGLAANFAAGNQTFGVRQTADFLEKATWTLAIIILALCILATAFLWRIPPPLPQRQNNKKDGVSVLSILTHRQKIVDNQLHL